MRRSLINFGSNKKWSVKKSRNSKDIIKKMASINKMHDDRAIEMGLGWRTVTSCILHRYPIIGKSLEPWELEYQNMQDKISSQRLQILEESMKGLEGSEYVPEPDMTTEELLNTLPFEPGKITTEADNNNDIKSMNRKLSDSLFFIVKRNRNDHSWQFPQGKLKDDENLRSSSERIIDRAVGDIRRWFIGNAPIGHICYPYPNELQQKRNEYGAKIF